MWFPLTYPITFSSLSTLLKVTSKCQTHREEVTYDISNGVGSYDTDSLCRQTTCFSTAYNQLYRLELNRYVAFQVLLNLIILVCNISNKMIVLQRYSSEKLEIVVTGSRKTVPNENFQNKPASYE